MSQPGPVCICIVHRLLPLAQADGGAGACVNHGKGVFIACSRAGLHSPGSHHAGGEGSACFKNLAPVEAKDTWILPSVLFSLFWILPETKQRDCGL